MDRRDFARFAAVAGVTWPAILLAQPSGKIWRIGFIGQGPEKFHGALFEGLRELGYSEGRNLLVERRYAEGHAERFAEFASEMVRLNVDLVVVSTTPAALAVKQATTTIPVVFPNAISPVESGVVANLARPGGNITGGAAQTAILSAKRIEILKEVLPGLIRTAVLWNAGNPALGYPWRETQAAAQALGVSLEPLELRGPADLGAAFDLMAKRMPEALIVLQDALTLQHRNEIIEFALRNRLPGMYVAKELVEAGGLMSYGENLADMYRRGAYFVDKIFKGTKPADLPVEQVTRFELILNLKAANTIGLKIPATFIARADEVIE
jgi:putative ABC transport system substrate-binding protein